MRLFIFIIIILPISIHAQSFFAIDGSVIDIQGRPLESATTILQNGETVIAVQLTDDKGYFSFNVEKGNYSIKVLYFGKLLFEKKFTIQESIHLGDIEVSSSVNLDEVIVRGESKSVKIDEDKLIFDVKKLAGVEGYKALDVLKYTPRVIVNGDKVSAGNKSATIFVNNRQLSESEAISYLSDLDAKDIDKIEVQSTHGGIYGAHIQGSIINIITKKKQIGLKGSTNVYGATPRKSFYEIDPSISLLYGTNRWNIYSSYSYNKGKSLQYSKVRTDYYNENIMHLVDGRYFSNQQDHIYKIGSTFKINNEHILGLEFNGINNRPSNNYSRDHIYYRNINDQDDAFNVTSYSFNNNLYNTVLSYSWAIDSLGSTLKVLANYNDKASKSKNYINTTYNKFIDRNISEINVTDAKSKNYSLESKFIKKWSSGYSLRAGIQYNGSRRNSILSTAQDNNQSWEYKEMLTGIYAGITKNFTPDIFTILTLRLENTNMKGTSQDKKTIKDNYNDIFPYLYFSQSITDKFSYNLLYTRTIYRPPFSFLNNYSVRISDILFDKGNPYLKPEKAHLGEVSFVYGKHSSTISYKYVPKAISEVFTVDNEITYHTNANSGSLRDLSIDYNFNGKIFSWWHTNAFTAFGYTKVPESYNRKHLGYIILSAVNTLTLNKVGDFILNVNRNKASIKDNSYYKSNFGCDISFRHSFLKNNLILRLGIDDVFDTRKSRSDTFVPNMDYSAYIKNLSQKIWINLTLRFSNKQNVNVKRIENNNSIKNRL